MGGGVSGRSMATAIPVLALALCCAVPRGVAGYMAEIKPSGAANAGTGATGVGIGDEVQGFNAGGDSAGAGAGVSNAPNLEEMAKTLPEQLVPGMDTLDVLKLLSGQTVVNDKPGSPFGAKRPRDTGDFNVKHDHDGDGHMCDPAAALRHLQVLKNLERGGGKKSKKKNKDEHGPVDPDAAAARLGFEQCLNDIMPGLLRATDFSREIPCHTHLAQKKHAEMKREVLRWHKRLQQTGHSKNEIGVATKTRKATAVYNGFTVCLKEAIPTLHEALLGTDESQHQMELVKVPGLKGGNKKKNNRRLLQDSDAVIFA